MNTRGLMGLIVLNIGLDLGVISPTLFAMMATAPVLRWLVPHGDRDAYPGVLGVLAVNPIFLVYRKENRP